MPPKRIRISTVARCGIEDDAEAACALADLSAGAFSQALQQILPDGPRVAPHVAQQLPDFSQPKADYIMRWLRDKSGHLCRVGLVVGLGPDGQLKVYRFDAFDDPAPTILLPPNYHEDRMRDNR
jgi:hypothetical protein